jgi:hypothetical protein
LKRARRRAILAGMANDAQARSFDGEPPPLAWASAAARIVVLVALNAVPIWGFTQEKWSPGTALALFWLQGAFGIPITALLIVMHRRETRKAGHYKGPGRSTFLVEFLRMSIPFVVAHGIFLAFILGVVWKDAAGAVDREDLRAGAVAMLNILAIGFAADMFSLRQRPFAWLRHRTQTLMQRTIVVHFVILFGMGAAAVFGNPAAFFAVFLALKLLLDLAWELPEWDPKEPPFWLVWVYARLGEGKDIHAYWKQIRTDQKAGFADDERVLTPAELDAL